MRPKQPDPVAEMKQAIARAVVAKLEGWSQEMAAALLRTNQPRISNLRNGQLDHFSLETLIRMATRINGYAYVEVRFREDGLGPVGTTRAPAGDPPDVKHITWTPAIRAERLDAASAQPQAPPHP